MMWDFSGSYASGNPSQPLAIPRPGFPVVSHHGDQMRGFPGPASFPTSPFSGPGMSSPYLTVPQSVPRTHSDPAHHHHHHHHHRTHSNPSPVDRDLLVRHHHRSHSSHSNHHHSQTTLVQPSHHHQSQPALAPVVHHHQAAAPPPPHHRFPTPAPIPAPAHHFFQYSKCTGRKKALCIGINYRGQPHELRGCINDARNMRNFLIRQWGYKSEDVVLLTDDNPNPRSQPTRKNMIDAMCWLVRNAQPHDSLFFHYSGHGGQTPDLDGDETDGFDEVIYPVDFKKRGFIVDDEMHKIMVKELPIGCRLTAVFDSCHSGTALDLPYIYSSHGRLKGDHIAKAARALKATKADVISWSGCRDDQTSADTFQGGVAVGAMSRAFIDSLTKNPKQSYQELLKSIRSILHSKYSQKPQLGSSHQINTNLRFIL